MISRTNWFWCLFKFSVQWMFELNIVYIILYIRDLYLEINGLLLELIIFTSHWSVYYILITGHLRKIASHMLLHKGRQELSNIWKQKFASYNLICRIWHKQSICGRNLIWWKKLCRHMCFQLKKDVSINYSCFIQRWLLHRFYGTIYQHNVFELDSWKNT